MTMYESVAKSRICAMCQKEFVKPKNPDQLTCSRKCGIERRELRKKLLEKEKQVVEERHHIVLKCMWEGCNEEIYRYQHKAKNQIWCPYHSKQLNTERSRKRAREKMLRRLANCKCKICGKQATSTRTLYCSKECRARGAKNQQSKRRLKKSLEYHKAKIVELEARLEKL